MYKLSAGVCATSFAYNAAVAFSLTSHVLILRDEDRETEQQLLTATLKDLKFASAVILPVEISLVPPDASADSFFDFLLWNLLNAFSDTYDIVPIPLDLSANVRERLHLRRRLLWTFWIIRSYDSSLRSEDFFEFACTTHLRGHLYKVNSEFFSANERYQLKTRYEVEGGSDDHVVASSSRVEETVESLAKERSAVEGRAKEFGVVKSYAKEEWAEEGPTAIEPFVCQVAALSLSHGEDIDWRVFYGGRSLMKPKG
ncbi:unnamed protein product [Schistocephalus solidus]|uniref:Uncharacterized protein n=1 Tax=Schistocephalus solidus TaxID=70667 RepID=A0A183SHX4_SCHSO|nr:unnamed protein product [Schistocephalus solidus]